MSEATIIDKTNLESHTIEELAEYCKEAKIPNYLERSKQELIQIIQWYG